MREIKFRGKLKHEDIWVYGDLKQNHGGATAITFNHITRIVNPETVGQYTGLKDKNGKEIYEGDIARHTVDYGPGGEGEHICKVVLTPFGVNMQPWIFEEKGYLPEIIGNIYEHPNLLGGGENGEGDKSV